jgi:tRNA pseudouridine-54 N-methylase
MPLKKLIKETLADFKEKYGFIKVSSAPFVLLYHRILNDPKSENNPVQPGMYVTTKTFNEHIKYLKKNYKIIPLCDLLDLKFNGRRDINKYGSSHGSVLLS